MEQDYDIVLQLLKHYHLRQLDTITVPIYDYLVVVPAILLVFKTPTRVVVESD